MRSKRIPICITAGLGVLFQAAAWAAPLKITLPPEKITFRAGPGAETAMAHCLQCHSSEYITSQPPLGRDAWRASIGKMRAKYGAVVSAGAETALVEYLAGNYGPAPAAQK